MDKVKEMYECDGISPGVKYTFIIYDDDKVELMFYNGAFKVNEPNVRIYDIGNSGGKRIEYGSGNVKASLPFKRYSDGELDEKWIRIK